MVGKNRKLLGQAAMEYLMTYGWALLVIVIVIAILLIMNPFSSPQSCKFDTVGFGCSNIAVKAGGAALGGITNGNNNEVNILSVTCKKASEAAPSAPSSNQGGTALARQGVYPLTSTTCTTAPATSGGDYSAKIYVFYRNAEDDATYPPREAIANLVTKVI